MDEIDFMVLRALMENPRASYRKIAEKLNVSPSTVARRVKRLVDKGIIKGFALLLNPEFAGATSCFAVLIRVKSGFKPREVGERLTSIPELCRIYVTAGKYDLICFFLSESRDRTAEIISRVKSTEGVAEVEPYVILYHVKDENFLASLTEKLKEISLPST